MRAFELSRVAVMICVMAALLSACGGGSPVPSAADRIPNGASGSKKHQTFSYTGSEQTFIVPAGVKRLTVVARGGQAGGWLNIAGLPGRVYAVVPVHPGSKLYIFVGASGDHGGFNGGGAGGTAGSGYYSEQGGGGGGASDVRMGGDKLQDRIIVAAGGGGSGESWAKYEWAWGGNGGGLAGLAGGSIGYSNTGGGGGGGTQSQGGAGGSGGQGSGNGQPGGNGVFGLGGNGGNGGPGPYCRGSYGYCYGMPGGGGGGGYYGGGAGGGGAAGYATGNYRGNQSGGGGGGSSYVEPRAITSRTWTGWRGTGDGRVIFSWN